MSARITKKAQMGNGYHNSITTPLQGLAAIGFDFARSAGDCLWLPGPSYSHMAIT
jgi:hypothetical protein